MWIDEETIKLYSKIKRSNYERYHLLSDLAITTTFMIKCVFSMPLRSLQKFINPVLKFAPLSLLYLDYSSISKQAK
ncbi:transposase [Candidatus Enterovibrio altilux]|nr:transposase [Candidatus Enterovibrio luxaltus]